MKKYIFISDLFLDQYRGGAELTTDALMRPTNQTPLVIPIPCSKVTKEFIESAIEDNCHFIVCNFSSLDDKIKLFMCKNTSYSIVEYDYKICDHRSFELHELIEGSPCDCETRISGKINTAFYAYAEKIWFMSDAQKNLFLSKISALKEEKCEVLNSVFHPGDLKFMYSIKDNEKDNKYLILGSQSWIKGTEECIQYAKDNGMEYEIVTGLPYHELLIKMSTSKGLIFRPLGNDTCPRIVMEAKMLGCDLILNDYVQHKDEVWFKTQESCYEHMNSRSDTFWSQHGQ